MKPVMVGDPPSERLCIGFVARRYINKGEELFFNYGIKDKQLPWSTTNAKKAATSLQKTNSTSKKVCVTICTCYYKYILLWWNKFTFVILTFFMFHYYLHVHICINLQAGKRRYHCCIVEGCEAVVKKLSEHIWHVHGVSNKDDRKKLLQLAREVRVCYCLANYSYKILCNYYRRNVLMRAMQRYICGKNCMILSHRVRKLFSNKMIF